MTGRPSKYRDKIADEICDRIADDESLESICRDDHMPSSATVRVWLRDKEVFQANYVRAREEQAHTVADLMGDIRKKVLTGEYDPQQATAAANIAKWETGKRNPKKYGDKQLIGSDPDNPLPDGFSVNLLKPNAKR